jgi:hypothetical protein
MKLDKYLQQDHPDLYGLPTSEALVQALKRTMRREDPKKTVVKSDVAVAPRQQSSKNGKSGHSKNSGVGHRWRLKRS